MGKKGKIEFVKAGEGGQKKSSLGKAEKDAEVKKGALLAVDDDDDDDDDVDFEAAESGSDESSSSDDEDAEDDEEGMEGDDDDDDDDDNSAVTEDPLAMQSSITDGNGFRVFSATVASNCPNEDRLLVDVERGLFGVFDGHGGHACSSFALEMFPKEFDKQLEQACGDNAKARGISSLEAAFFSSGEGTATSKKGGTDTDKDSKKNEKPRIALKGAFTAIDQAFLDQKGKDFPTSGSCALVCYVEHGTMWAGNVGDSRAILVRKKKGVTSVPVSEDQNTNNKYECSKVSARSKDPDAVRYNESEERRRPDSVRRVAGTLMVTRALGDGYLKREELSQFPYKTHIPYITGKPKVRKFNITTSETVLVVASDGVWEHLSNDAVALEVDKFFAMQDEGKRGDCGTDNAAMYLVNKVIQSAADKQGLQAQELKKLPPGRHRRTLLDDISIIVVQLHRPVKGKRGREEGSKDAEPRSNKAKS